MIKFKTFLTEAKVSEKNFNKVAEIFRRIYERELNQKTYRYGGERGIVEIKNGIGILYMDALASAIRINYVGGEIISLTFWNRGNFRTAKKGDYTIDVSEIGLMQTGRKIIEMIKNHQLKPGKYPMFKLNESYSMLAEAKRTTVQDFVDMASKSLPNGRSLKNLFWSDISDIAMQNGVQIPGTIRTSARVKTARGEEDVFDLTKVIKVSTDFDSEQELEKEAARKDDPTYYFKITSQDPLSKKFMSVKGDKRAEEMLKKARYAITNPNVKEEMKDPNKLFGIMRNLVQVIARDARKSLVIYGGPGTGKTFTVEQTLKEEGLTQNRDWFQVKGKVTNASLYQTLFMHRKNKILVFDDTDSIWGDSEAANILKAALDSYDKRIISWYSARTFNVSKMTEDEKEAFNNNLDVDIDSGSDKLKFPSEFEYNGRIIFISNLPYEKFDSAVLTRSAKIDMTLTPEQMFMRIEGIIDKIGRPEVPVEMKKEILEFIREKFYRGELDAPSMRTFIAAEDMYASDMPNWKELVDFA